MRALSLLLIVFLALTVQSPLAQAQFGTTEPLTLSVSPKYPKPFERVTVTVVSTLLNLSASTITISVNGSMVSESGKSAVIQMGAAGTKSTVAVSATTDGKTYTKSFVLTPTDVALIVEPTTTAHPLYEGARLIAPESRIRLIAMANMRTATGTRIPENQLSYAWKLGDKLLSTQSGLGKNVLSATAPVRYRDAQVSVTVTTQDASQAGYASVFISPVTPLVRIYSSDPLLGTDFATALTGTYTLASGEETFKAVSYFFEQPPQITWALNGAQSGSEDTITVRTAGNSAGTAQLSVGATAKESAQSRVTLQFGSSNKNIFGF